MDVIFMTNYSFKRQYEMIFKNYFLCPCVLRAHHSFILSDPCVKVCSTGNIGKYFLIMLRNFIKKHLPVT